MYIDLHVKYPLFLPDFNKNWIFYTDFRKKISKIKVHKNPSNGSQVVPCGRTDGRADRHDEANSPFAQFGERTQMWIEKLQSLRI